MSLFSTIAQEGSLPREVSPRRGIATILVVALLVSVGVFFATDLTDDSPVATDVATSGLSHEEFIRLNTTALDALIPAVASVSQMDVDSFLYWNTTALNALVSAKSDTQGADVGSFIYWNTAALEYPQAPVTDPESGPR